MKLEEWDPFDLWRMEELYAERLAWGDAIEDEVARSQARRCLVMADTFAKYREPMLADWLRYCAAWTARPGMLEDGRAVWICNTAGYEMGIRAGATFSLLPERIWDTASPEFRVKAEGAKMLLFPRPLTADGAIAYLYHANGGHL